jgi:predicted RNA-binding Zn-ribbon protein involved in translation (DUF1610 family)
MVKKEMYCTSCKTKIVSSEGITTFKCPSCEKKDIVRCKGCRVDSIPYVCSCGFEGPN